MKKLEERILHDGNVLGENILKVDSFLTHQVDFSLMKEIGRVFADTFRESGITKVVTIEASGIAPAVYTAEALGVPMIFAKKAKNITMTEGILTAEVYSFTKQVTSTVSIAGKFLSPSDKVLVIDDFWLMDRQLKVWLKSFAKQEQVWKLLELSSKSLFNLEENYWKMTGKELFL